MKLQRDPQNDADVRLLLKVFPDLLPDGRRISHEQLEATLSLSRISSRYRTVTKRWRRVVFDERRVYVDGTTAEGKGFVCLTPDDMVRFANRTVRAAGRKIKLSFAVLSAPDDSQLSADMLRYRRLMETAVLKMASDHKASLRDLGKALAPQRQLPRASGG